jgi:type I restriction-modification system DNA methylase subunit
MIALHLTFEPSFDTTARVYVHNTLAENGEIDPDFDDILDRFEFTIEENDDLLDTFDGNHYIDEYGLIPSPNGAEALWIAHCAEIVPRFAAWVEELRHATK